MIALLFHACFDQRCPPDMVHLTGNTFVLGEDHPSEDWHLTGRPYEIKSFCIDRYEYPNKRGTIPEGNVSFESAKHLCDKIGKRLCTEPEWELACKGPQNFAYSYGKKYEKDFCNTRINGHFAPSGQYSNCKSPEGVYDLNGNLSEWVDAEWPSRGKMFVDWKTLRGGTVNPDTHYGQDCTSRHGHHGRDWMNRDDGFRCCKNL